MNKKIITLFPFLLVFYEVATYLSNDMYLPALPSIMHDLLTTHSLTQLTITTWALGASSIQLFMGPLADRFGRRPILFFGGIIFIISTVMCAISTNIIFLLFSRFLQGTAVCSVTVAGYATIHELFDQQQAIKTLALMGSITVLAPAFGPLLGGLIMILINWRWTFWFLAIWSIIALILLFKYMPETNPHDAQYSLQLKPLFHNYKLIIKNINFTRNTLVFCLMFSGMIIWIAAGPFLVISEFGYHILIFGFFQALIFSCYIFGAHLVNAYTSKMNISTWINTGLWIALSGGVISLLFAILFPHFLLGLIISLMIYSGGSALAFAPLQRIAIEASDQPMGARMAVFSSAMSGAAAFASILVSIFYDNTLLSVAAIICVVMLLAVFIHWKWKINYSTS